MYKVFKDCEQIAIIEKPVYIKSLSDGTFTPATEADCQGIAINSVPYNLFGCTAMDGVTDTVVLCECDGGIEMMNHLGNGGYNKEEILSDAAKVAHGLTADATPNDVFLKLALPLNTYGFKIIAKFSDGAPAKKLALPGLFGLDGNVAITDENGIAYAYSETQEAVITMSGLYGVTDTTKTFVNNTSYVFTPVDIEFEKDETVHLIETSGEYNVYDGVLLDVCAVGGGGAGGPDNRNSIPGGGGGGGYVTNVLGLANVDKFTVSIGAGGVCSGGTALVGGDGGVTSVTIDGEIVATANGGSGGGRSGYPLGSGTYNGQPGAAGVGNGNGGSNSVGGNGTVRVFNDDSLPLPGGGGGSGAYAGGLDFGGAGGNGAVGSTGTGPGGGGGGSKGNDTTITGGSGHAGGVYVRARFE